MSLRTLYFWLLMTESKCKNYQSCVEISPSRPEEPFIVEVDDIKTLKSMEQICANLFDTGPGKAHIFVVDMYSVYIM